MCYDKEYFHFEKRRVLLSVSVKNPLLLESPGLAGEQRVSAPRPRPTLSLLHVLSHCDEQVSCSCLVDKKVLSCPRVAKTLCPEWVLGLRNASSAPSGTIMPSSFLIDSLLTQNHAGSSGTDVWSWQPHFSARQQAMLALL